MKKRRVGKTQLEIDVLGLGGAPLGGNFRTSITLKGLKSFLVRLMPEFPILIPLRGMDLGAQNVWLGIDCEERITYCQAKWDVYWLQAQSTSRGILV